MDVIHRLSINAYLDGAEIETLIRHKIRFKTLLLPAPTAAEQGLQLVTFEVSESDSRWEVVKPLITSWNCLDIITTKFNSKDLANAAFFQLLGSSYCGYPMPDNDNGFRNITYDITSGCVVCGVGYEQKSPFRMKGEPKWGKNLAAQLHWVNDEFFVHPDAFEKVFLPLGISCREVIHHRKETRLTSVLQLVIELTDAKLGFAPQTANACVHCGKIKYAPISCGFFPKMLAQSDMLLFKTQEWIGLGGAAWRPTIISREIFDSIKQNGLKGFDFQPLET